MRRCWSQLAVRCVYSHSLASASPVRHPAVCMWSDSHARMWNECVLDRSCSHIGHNLHAVLIMMCVGIADYFVQSGFHLGFSSRGGGGKRDNHRVKGGQGLY